MQELINQKVTVHSIQGATEKQDVGILEAFDGTVLKIKKSDDEILYFTIYWVRLIKAF